MKRSDFTPNVLLKRDASKFVSRLSYVFYHRGTNEIVGLTARWIVRETTKRVVELKNNRQIFGSVVPSALLKAYDCQSDELNDATIVGPEHLVVLIKDLKLDKECFSLFTTGAENSFPVLDMGDAIGRNAFILGKEVGKIIAHYDRMPVKLSKETLTFYPLLHLQRNQSDITYNQDIRMGSMVSDDQGMMIGVVIHGDDEHYSIAPLEPILNYHQLRFLTHDDFAPNKRNEHDTEFQEGQEEVAELLTQHPECKLPTVAGFEYLHEDFDLAIISQACRASQLN